MIGKNCVRQIQFEYLRTPKSKDFDGRALRKFSAGHKFEAMTAYELREGGFKLKTADDQGHQFGFEIAGGLIK